MTIGSLFSGIGLLDLGLQRAGLGEPAWQVEIDAWCRRVLARHWPHTERHDAGSRRGAADERALWPEYARVIDEAKPAIVIAENVPGLRTIALRGVLADLADLGFDAEWCCFRASDLGAPHRRNRLWIVATHPDRVTIRQQPGWLSRSIGAALATQSRIDREIVDPDADGVGRVEHAIRVATLRGWSRHCGWQIDPTPRVDDGRSRDVGRRRRALGNGVAVPCAELVGRAIIEATS